MFVQLLYLYFTISLEKFSALFNIDTLLTRTKKSTACHPRGEQGQSARRNYGIRTLSLSHLVNHLDHYIVFRHRTRYLGFQVFLSLFSPSLSFSLCLFLSILHYIFSVAEIHITMTRACTTSSIRDSLIAALVLGRCVYRSNEKVLKKKEIRRSIVAQN